ncbi:cupin domain-containing protein [Pontibacter cellulosilyticus]|uniref:Cupin domain-containing protein n=1 Tax=Pontibacter cellulosilyticus TaxID=1720253 RepID=A0A923NA26_9BACT|nr:cupin domain-containing protein [Pontibacter cellulosilyticus]MBC5995046.1 cupin domain-containing protein [Pontibacter cellulosilyticus]
MAHQAITSLLLQPHGNIPNNPALPVLLYRQVLSGSSNLVDAFKNAFQQNNWGGSWVNGVFDYHHYHSKSHEVLGVAAGSATLILGGPNGEEVEVKAGDMVVLPAGTGHCRKSASADFKVVGAYPEGQENYDICTEDADMADKQKNIKQVSLPAADPVAGEDGPLLKHWTNKV